MKKRFPQYGLPAVVVIVVLLVIVGGWSWLWFRAAGKAKVIVNQSVERIASAGGELSFDTLRFSGYPFAMRVTVDGALLKYGETSFKLPRLSAVSSVWKPKELEFTSESNAKLEISALQTVKTSVSYKDGGLRIVLNEEGMPGELTMDVSDVQVGIEAASKAKTEGLALNNPNAFSASHITMRRTFTQGAEEFEMKIDNANLRDTSGKQFGPIDSITISTLLSGVLKNGDKETLEKWRTGGGKFIIRDVSVMGGPASMHMKGDVTLDGLLRPEGRVDIKINGLKALAKSQSSLAEYANLVGLMLVGLSEKPATENVEDVYNIIVLMKDGVFSISGKKISELPSVVFEPQAVSVAPGTEANPMAALREELGTLEKPKDEGQAVAPNPAAPVTTPAVPAEGQ